MRNLPIKDKRCRGADTKFRPTLCANRDQCQRHIQLDLDRQLELPADVMATIPVMLYPRVGEHDCHFFLPAL